jgi:hypothetical protein
MIKIFIPSYRRSASATTPALLDEVGADYKLVIRETEYADYAKNFPKRRLLVIGKNDDLTKAREHTRSLLKNGEWCLHIDDDMKGFVQCNAKFYASHERVPLKADEEMITRKRWQKTMSEKVNFAAAYCLAIEDTMQQCEERGAYLGGFSAWENPAFRGRKFTDVGYVCGGMMLMRKQKNLPWRQSLTSSCEDYALTSAHLYENGRVLINKWLYPVSKIYQAGGCGPYEERLPSMVASQQNLLGRYGDLLGAKNANSPEKRQGELRIRMREVEQVEQWRSSLSTDPNFR